jgi:hypothetical protein
MHRVVAFYGVVFLVFGVADAAPAADVAASIRVICQTEWRDEMLSKPAPESRRIFDITLSFADIPAHASAGELFRLAEQRSGARAATDFLSIVRVLRQEHGSPSFECIERRRLRDASPLAPLLRSGDVVVFHGIVDRF